MLFLWMLFFSAPQYEVVWEHTNVYIEVYDDVDAYTMLPEAYLYHNGNVVATTLITYERGVDRTFLSVLTSVELKTFYIKYRVHFLSYGITDTVTIAFHIVDTTPPEVTLRKELIIPYGEKVNIKEYVNVSDNYDQNEKLKLTFLDAQVNWGVVGTYEASIIVEDTSGNQTKIDVSVSIKDYIAPVIMQKKTVVIEPFEQLNIQQFFTIKDNVDQTVLVWLVDDMVKYHELGFYEAMICARDNSFNESCYSFLVEIKDTIAPVVVLSSQSITIDVYTELTQSLMMSWFVVISDDYDKDNINVQFYHQINTSTLGSYDVVVEVYDQSSNVTTESFKVLIVDRVAPEVTLITPTIHVFEPLNPLVTYVYIEDNYDHRHDLNVKMNTNLDTTLLGMYQLEVEVSDLSKNKRLYTFLIEVVDRVAPIVEIEDALIITDFKRPEYDTRLMVSDNYDDRIHIDMFIYDQNVIYEQPGMYEIKVELIDHSGNVSITFVDVIVVDIVPPELEIYETTLRYELGYADIDLWSNIKYVNDNITYISTEDVIIEESIDVNQVGRYVILYHVSDEANSKTTRIAYVIIEDTIPPIIDTQTLVYQLGSPLDPFDGITSYDQSEVHINLINKEIFEQKVGTYVLSYVAYDANGNHTVFEREVKVENNRLIKDIIPYQRSMILFIFGIISSWFTWHVFRKKGFDKSLQIEYNEE